jgi:hypothetical protein
MTDPILTALPTEPVLLDCGSCGHLWAQTLGQALRDPLGICRCPRCGADYRFPADRADVPIAAEEVVRD